MKAVPSELESELNSELNMANRTFYFFSEPQLEVSSAAPVEMSASEWVEQLLPFVRDQEDYIGLLDESDNLLQVSASTQPGRYVVELPDATARISFRREMSLGELTEFLHRLPDELILARFQGFEAAKW